MFAARRVARRTGPPDPGASDGLPLGPAGAGSTRHPPQPRARTARRVSRRR